MRQINEIEKFQKDIPDLLYLYVTRKYSKYFTALCYDLGLHPNILTYGMFVFGIIGSSFFATGTIWSFNLGAAAFIFLNLLDTSDGELARLMNNSSKNGAALDKLVHLFTNPLMIISLGIGLWKLTTQEIWLYISAATLAFYVMGYGLKTYRTAPSNQTANRIYLLFKLIFDFQAFWHLTFIFTAAALIFHSDIMPFWIFYTACFLGIIILKTAIEFHNFLRRSRAAK